MVSTKVKCECMGFWSYSHTQQYSLQHFSLIKTRQRYLEFFVRIFFYVLANRVTFLAIGAINPNPSAEQFIARLGQFIPQLQVLAFGIGPNTMLSYVLWILVWWRRRSWFRKAHEIIRLKRRFKSRRAYNNTMPL